MAKLPFFFFKRGFKRMYVQLSGELTYVKRCISLQPRINELFVLYSRGFIELTKAC